MLIMCPHGVIAHQAPQRIFIVVTGSSAVVEADLAADFGFHCARQGYQHQQDYGKKAGLMKRLSYAHSCIYVILRHGQCFPCRKTLAETM